MKLTPHDIEDFYSKHVAFDDATRVTQRDGSVELTTCCPFHEDNTASLSINLKKGVYKCHAQSCPQSEGGSIYQFYSETERIDMATARKKLHDLYRKEPKKLKDFPVTERDVEQWHINLLNNKEALEYLQHECRYTLATIEEFELGWNGSRITIPVRQREQLVNVRQYSPKSKGGPKLLGVGGFNTPKLWPLETLDNQDVYIFEGEKDCMLANQLGLPALTVTGGAGSFDVGWRTMFVDKNVIICYDIDESGTKGAEKVAEILTGVAKEIRVVKLPIDNPSNADFTDYIIQKHTIQDFYEVVNKTKPLAYKDSSYVEIDDTVVDTTLEEASYGGKYFQRQRMRVRILGKDMAPFIIPRKLTATCADGKQAKCLVCGLAKHKGNTNSIELDETRPELLAFLNCSTAQQRVILRQAFHITGQCNTFNVKQEAHQFVEQASVIPYIDEQTFDEEYIRRDMFVINHNLESNRDYEIEALTVPDPRTQYLVHVVYKAKPCETSIEEFEMSDELFNELKVFQCTYEINSDTSTQTCQQT